MGVAIPAPPWACQLRPGEVLPMGWGILDPTSRFLLAMQTDGNLVLYDQGNGNVAYWASNTAGSGAVRAQMQTDGNLVLSRSDGSAVWGAVSGRQIAGTWATLQTDGNLVLYFRAPEVQGNALWASASQTSPGLLDRIGSSLSSAADSFVAAIHEIPGVDWAGSELKDFASTSFGQWFLRIVASVTSAGLAGVIGPQLASVAFAVPGLAAGDTFSTSWLQEEVWRIKETARILAGDAAQGLSDEMLAQLEPYIVQFQGLASHLEDAAKGLLAQAGNAAQIPSLIQSYALQYGGQALSAMASKIVAREDVTQMVEDAVMGTDSFARAASAPYRMPVPFDGVQIRGFAAVPGKVFDPASGAELTNAGELLAGLRASTSILAAQKVVAAGARARLDAWVRFYAGQGPAPF